VPKSRTADELSERLVRPYFTWSRMRKSILWISFLRSTKSYDVSGVWLLF
jgi:hypothetical protein